MRMGGCPLAQFISIVTNVNEINYLTLSTELLHKLIHKSCAELIVRMHFSKKNMDLFFNLSLTDRFCYCATLLSRISLLNKIKYLTSSKTFVHNLVHRFCGEPLLLAGVPPEFFLPCFDARCSFL